MQNDNWSEQKHCATGSNNVSCLPNPNVSNHCSHPKVVPVLSIPYPWDKKIGFNTYQNKKNKNIANFSKVIMCLEELM